MRVGCGGGGWHLFVHVGRGGRDLGGLEVNLRNLQRGHTEKYDSRMLTKKKS